jgi:hypothetical protein
MVQNKIGAGPTFGLRIRSSRWCVTECLVSVPNYLFSYSAFSAAPRDTSYLRSAKLSDDLTLR